MEGRDPGIISALRSFGRLLNSSNLGGSTAYMKRIKDIRAGGFFDVICRVWCMLYKDLLACAPFHGVPHPCMAHDCMYYTAVIVCTALWCLIPQVHLQVLCINDQHLDSPVMFVWDGTDALPLPFT